MLLNPEAPSGSIARSLQWSLTTYRRMGMTELVMVLMTVQNVASSLVIEISRSAAGHNTYSPASVVLVSEFMKLAMSVGLLLFNGESLPVIARTLSRVKASDSLRLAVPATIYTVQNNLVFLALQNINSATFQIISQLKVLTTAAFSVTLLGRRLSKLQWIALLILSSGVILANRQHHCDSASPQAATASGVERRPWVGVSAVTLLALLSGFAGVYQERIVKGSLQLPIHYLNIQMCLFSIVTNVVSVVAQDGLGVFATGLLHGYTSVTWAVVLIQSVGGILVSLVIRYASNLAKSYVVSVAIVLTGILSFMFMGFDPNAEFLIGAVLVVVSIVLYNEPDPRQVAEATKESKEDKQTSA
jgi:UDP-sugar transporter A1/2/3